MTDGTHNEGEGPSMHPKLAEFFGQTFAQDGRRHTLVLGELHHINDHTRWLKDHLDEVQARGVNTLGSEMRVYMNVFLWAYEDGTLARELGGQKQAQDYVRMIWQAKTSQEFKYAVPASADLLMAAIDHGMHAVCYDARDSVSSGDLSRYMTKKQGQLDTQTHRLLADDNRLHTGKTVLAQFHEPGSENINDVWFVHELNRLLEGNPEYCKKLDAIDALVTVGARLIDAGSIGSDGLSACVMQVLAPNAGNTITIGGLGHNFGIMRAVKDKNKPHGLFSHHLQSVAEYHAGGELVDENAPRAHRVSTAVLAHSKTVQHYKNSSEELKQRCDERMPSAIPIINLDDGSEQTVISYDKKDAKRLWTDDQAYTRLSPKTTLTEQWFFPPQQFDEMKQGRIKQFANPMLIPELKKACDSVQAAMHGEPARGR